MQKLKVGLLGATGCVGQIYLEHLINHPYFELSFLTASESSCGLSIKEALLQKQRALPSFLNAMEEKSLSSVNDIEDALKKCDFVFSALESRAASLLEPLYAQSGLPVISNASSFRMDSDIPIFIPELNVEHLGILKTQQQNRKWERGFIVTKSNCSLISYLLPLYPLHQYFEIQEVIVTTFQSVSGAGFSGLSGLECLNNVIPYIPGEEEKSEHEFLKILGKVKENKICSNASIKISAQCTRVPTLRGHLATVSVRFKQKPMIPEILKVWKEFKGSSTSQHLPSSPKELLIYQDNPFHPQPALDLYEERQMSAVLGRLRPCPVLDYRFVCLTDNLKRGAALGGILSAEYLTQKGFLNSYTPKEITVAGPL